MTIKQFFILVFFIGFSLSVYLTVQYREDVLFVEENKPIDNYKILDFRCHKAIRMSSFIDLIYKKKEYHCSVTNNTCSKIEKGEIKAKFYYVEKEDKIIFKGQFFSYGFMIISYMFTFILPLIGFIVYRKELNNKFSTM